VASEVYIGRRQKAHEIIIAKLTAKGNNGLLLTHPTGW